jgi:pimeloyl-ACP methyl ester carboxylesterase
MIRISGRISARPYFRCCPWQTALIRWTPKCPLDFRALIREPAPRSAFRGLNFPALIPRGEHAPTPTRMIAEDLSRLLPAARLIVINGAGHMGPLTHGPEVCELVIQHCAIRNSEQARGWRPGRLASIFGAALQPAKAVP